MNREWLRRHRHKALAAALVAILLVVALLYRALLIAWFSGEPLGDSGEAVTRQVGDLSIAAELQPDPPRQNDNTLRLRVSGPDGEPVEAADVSVVYSMPAMGAMPEMKGEAEVDSQGAGSYVAKFSLPMAGSWTLNVNVDSPKGDASASYSLTVGSKGLTLVGAEAPGLRAAEAGVVGDALELPPQHFSSGVMASLRTALDAYEEVRSRLAADTIEEVAPRAERIARALRAAAESTRGAPRVREAMEEGAKAAQELGGANELDAARLAFGQLSRALVALVGADERLSESLNVFECPMTQGYDKWIQPTDQLMNPYMGQKMLECGSEVEWKGGPADVGEGQGVAGAGGDAEGDEIAHYTCPMHPSVKQEGPGQCPICGMDLTPVTKEEVQSGVIFIDAARRQLIGVKTGKVERREIEKTIRTVGEITYDQERLVDVSTKFKGWVEKLYADSIGVHVEKGQTLFTVYSPELYAAQQDLLIASGRGAGGGASSFLLDSAKQRLKLWDVPSSFIERVLDQGEAIRNVPITAPATGFVIEKNIVEGSSIEPGAQLLRIANLEKVWIEAALYEAELPLVSKGQEASVTLPYLPGKRFTGTVAFVYPYLSGETRTGRVRIELDNDDVELKPDMYATVELAVDRGERLVVPESAVIYAGPRRIVFVDLGEGRLRPQEIEVGIKTGDYYEVLSGLRPGDTVVTSGNFLVAAESRLKSAEGVW